MDEQERTFKTIAVLGSGSWGCALAMHLAKIGHAVSIWDIDTELIEQSASQCENARYLPGHSYPDSLKPVTSLASVIEGAQVVVLAIPSHAIDTVLSDIKEQLDDNALLILASKGLAYNDRNTVSTLYSLVEDQMGCGRTVVLSGPSFAKEVAEGQPTGLVAASADLRLAHSVHALMNTKYLRIYPSEDPIGVQLCGALKNVLAIAVGIAEGMGFAANAQAILMTRGYHEVFQLGRTMGACTSTFLGLAGMGDLFLTCSHNLSRNRRFGLALGVGDTVEQAVAKIGQVVEGLKNVEEAYALGQQYNVELPIIEQIYRVIIDGVPATEAAEHLLSRASDTTPDIMDMRSF